MVKATRVIFTKYSGTEPSLQYHNPPASPASAAVVEVEAEVEEVVCVAAFKIRAAVLSAKDVGSVTTSMAPASDHSYFPIDPEVAVVAAVVAGEVTKEDAVAAAVGTVVVVVDVVDVVDVVVVVAVAEVRGDIRKIHNTPQGCKFGENCSRNCD